MKIQRYPSVEAAAAAGDYYAVNISDLGNTRVKGNVIIAFKAEDGAQVNISFPPTWLPLDLRDYATAASLERATTLRQYVRDGLIMLIAKASYEELKKDAAYAVEKTRVEKFQKTYSASASGGGSATTDFSLNLTGGMASQTSGTADGREAISTPQTDMILASATVEEVVRNMNSMVQGLSFGEIRTLMTKSPAGSLINLLAMEIDMRMASGEKTQDVTKLAAYTDFMKKSTENAGPSMEY